jgi:MFS family permease
LLIGGSLTAFNIGLSAGSELGQTDFYGESRGLPPYAIPLVMLSLVLLAAFVLVERRVRYPLLDLNLLRQRNTGSTSAVNVLFGFALALALANVPLFIHTRLELRNLGDPNILSIAAWDSGWMLSALTLTMAVVAVPGGWLTNRAGARLPVLLGTAIALAGFLLMSFTWQADTTYLTMALELILTGAGMGLVLSPVATVIINAAGEERHGIASALVITLRLVGMTIGVSTLTVWGVVRQDMLRRAGADDPLAMSDPAQFLINVAAQVISETFLFAAGACALALLLAVLMRRGDALNSPSAPAPPDTTRRH